MDFSPFAVGGAATRSDSFTKLRPEFASGVYRMVQDARAAGVPLEITSAYRSPDLQAQLFDDAVAKYGSPEAARKFVAPAGRSQHNFGTAVDFAVNGQLIRDPQSAEAKWIRENAAKYGLAVPMDWEPWQVELKGARAQTLGKGGSMLKPIGATPQMDKEEDKTDFRDIAGNLAIAFNSLRHRPDPNVAATVQNIQQQRTAKSAKNKSIEMLRGAGRDDIADAIESGAFSAKEGVSLMFREAAALRDQQSGVKNTALIRNAIAAGLKPNTPEFQQYILSGGDVYSQETQLLATLPKPKDGFGYEFDKDETGRITNYRLVPIEGGEADIKAKQAESAAAAQREAQSASGMVVLEDIGKALEIAKEKPFLSTGFVGGILKDVGGTAAKDLASLTTTIKANIGFDRLQRMREESPTGGALGQVAVQELEALQATLGNLDNSQTNEQVVGNLERLQEQYAKSMQEIYNAAAQDQANGRINKKTGRVISPLDYFSEQDINTLSGAPSGGPSDEDLLKKYGG